ncbi:hypothetical protein [Actinomadura sp. HBU206391]|nr:hypothetical protein [Actinomadura sp. HBU206391]MBC6456581.1 hypothetical protein [Actinomadura sp. HBU206391]
MHIANAVERLQAVTRVVLADFEGKRGYPPGENLVVPASGPEDFLAA